MNDRIARKIAFNPGMRHSTAQLVKAQRKVCGLKLPQFAVGQAVIVVGSSGDQGRLGRVRRISAFGTLAVQLEGDPSYTGGGIPASRPWFPLFEAESLRAVGPR